jgi:ribosomal peptide maturation radical SAM protein 1
MQAAIRPDGITLVSMPWESVHGPSIQLGTLHALLDSNGIPVQTRAGNLDFLEWCLAAPSERLTFGEYESLASDYSHTGLPEWIFAVPPYPSTESRDGVFLRELEKVVPASLLSAAKRVRRSVPRFLEQYAEEILRSQPRVIGFSLTHCQNISSLVLAKILKLRNPDVAIMLGGANCEGPMGVALHRAFPWVDLVVRGEAEGVLPGLIRSLLRNDAVLPVSGLCWRTSDGATAVVEPDNIPIRMGDVPLPDYSDYFDQIRRTSLFAHVLPRLRLVYESSRGCWWGEKSHCTFCGISSAAMPFRSKPPVRVVEEVLTLASRHRVLDFAFVDYIMDLNYFRDALPQLRSKGLDLRFFFEIKANLTREQVQMLRDAGVRTIQPGMESLSTPILKLLGKGVTALQNIRLLKWCEEYGVKPVWNLLTGIPREPAEEYARMANVMRALTHLEPPNVTEIGVYRFSPYFKTPRELGIEVTGPAPFYQALYPIAPELREDLAYFFDHRHLDGRDPHTYTAQVQEVANLWREGRSKRRNSLRYRRGPGFLHIVDERPGFVPARYSFNEEEARLYLACEDSATVPELIRTAGVRQNADDTMAFLAKLESVGLVYQEQGRYLSLALPSSEGLLPRRNSPTEVSS